MTEEERIELLPEEKKNQMKMLMAMKPKDLPENPEKNTWYTYRPEGALCSDGEPYYGTMKIGTENKVMVMICGGGVALDAFSAARPNQIEEEEGKPTFYLSNTSVIGYFFGRSGLANSEKAENPFKDWSVVVIPYASGDFHIGTNDFEYEDEEFGKGICRHCGYLNYRSMVEKMKELVPCPDQVMATGFSAGGFGTALLTDDVIGLFHQCKDFTCLVDSAFMCYSGWQNTVTNQWKAPKSISEKLVSENITVDCLLDLHRKHGDKVKIAIDCTYRDAPLSQIQNYADKRPFIFDEEGGDRFQSVLKKSVQILSKEIPNIAIYIFDKPNLDVTVGNLTDHTIIATDAVLDYEYDGVRIIDWIVSFMNGKPQQIGLELLN